MIKTRSFTWPFYLDIVEHELAQVSIDELLWPKMIQIVRAHQENIDQLQLLNSNHSLINKFLFIFHL